MSLSDRLHLPKQVTRRVSLLVQSGLYTVAGAAHFVAPDMYVRIMPPYVPLPRAMVYLSGVASILGGLGLLPAQTRRWAGLGLALYLVAVFPANLHMALHADAYAPIPEWSLWARLPLQVVLIAWVMWASKPVARSPSASS